MGAFLHIGFVAKATAELPSQVSKTKFLKEIEDYCPAEIFDNVESEVGKITLTLKPEVAREELLPFVRQVYEDYYGTDDKAFLKDSLAFIRKNAGMPDWLEKAAEADLDGFSPIDYGLSYDFEIAGQSVWLNPTIITLGSEGKFLMEECDRTLQFLETCAHRAYSNFRLGTTFRVYVL